MAGRNDNDTDNGEKMTAPPDFDGPTTERKCTDILCSILLLVMWGVMTGIGIYAYRHGDFRVVFYPMDYDGNICGTDYGDIDMTDYTKLVYINNYGGGVCVKECPKVEELTDPFTLLTYSGVYQPDSSLATLPIDYVDVADYSTAENVVSCTDDASYCPADPSSSWFSKGINQGNGFAFYAVDTVEVLRVRCLTNPSALTQLRETSVRFDESVLNIESLDTAGEFFTNLFGDIYESRLYVIGFGLGAAMALGFTYAQLLRIPCILKAIIWTSILGTIAIIFGTAGYAFQKANEWDAADPPEYKDSTIFTAKVFSYILFGIGALVTLLVVFLRKEIQLAVVCVKEAARAIAAMPLIILFPIIQTIGFLAFMGVWLFYIIHLASLGEVVFKTVPTDNPMTVRWFQFDDFVENCGWYFLFCFFWTSNFIVAIGEIIIAMCVGKWYFTRDKSRLRSCMILQSMSIAMYYHIGTAAFGSAIIAVIQIIRAIITKIQKKAEQMDSKVAQALLCCCQCCLWCFQKFMEFLNKNAYIQTAIFGTPFCRSAREAFALIARNAKRVGSITYVSEVVLFLGKIFISSLTAGAAYIYMEREIGTVVFSLTGPTVVIFFMAYFVGDMFLDIFEMSTATILQCFIADEEMFDGADNYAEGELRKWLDDYEEEEKKIKF